MPLGNLIIILLVKGIRIYETRPIFSISVDMH